ncbi:MAG: IS200/IS605 family accessory protein TnpB-related protein [Psychromonas sp.]
MKRTYQTRFDTTDLQGEYLDRYASLYSKCERTLFAETIAQGKRPESVKNAYLKRFDITSRQFNAICRFLKGKVKSIKELRKTHLSDLNSKLKKMASTIKKMEKQLTSNNQFTKEMRSKVKFALHQKKRRQARLMGKVDRILAEQETDKVHLCFGSKKLFKAQHQLEENGFNDHADWLTAWQSKRCSEFVVMGSKDETAGCQGCVMLIDAKGDVSLRLRLPNSLVTQETKFVTIPIELNYGKKAILHALANHTAICYRFKRDSKGWRVFISVDAPVVELVTNTLIGSIVVDINAEHLAVAETDHFGNLVNAIRIPLNTYGKSTEQTKAIIGDAVKTLIDFADQKQKPIVIEKLDFAKKKAELEALANDKYQKRYARMLSSLAYNQIKDIIKARGFDNGIEILEVNPTYTSVIGFWKFATRYGISSHQAAALVIARRALKLSESPNRQDYNATQLPVKDAYVHVWSYWRKVVRKSRKLAVLHSLRNQSSYGRLAAQT